MPAITRNWRSDASSTSSGESASSTASSWSRRSGPSSPPLPAPPMPSSTSALTRGSSGASRSERCAPMEYPTSSTSSRPRWSNNATTSRFIASSAYAAESVGFDERPCPRASSAIDAVALVEQEVEDARAHVVHVGVGREPVQEDDGAAVALVVVVEAQSVEALEVRHGGERYLGYGGLGSRRDRCRARERAAVDHQGVTGDPRRAGAGEEARGAGDVLGLTETAQRQPRGHDVARGLPERAGEVGLHEARGDAVHPHAAGRARPPGSW